MMERATVYRMISGLTAIFAGLVALLMVFVFPWDNLPYANHSGWKWIWYCAAAAVLFFNTALVIAKAKRENGAVFSPGLKMGLRAILPPLFIGFVIGLYQFRAYNPTLLAWIWMLCYGTSLMATGSFAPRSVSILGGVFIVTGLLYFQQFPSGENGFVHANFMMVKTFVIYHLLYGLYVILIENKRS